MTLTVQSIIFPIAIVGGLILLRDLFFKNSNMSFVLTDLLLTSVLAFITNITGDAIIGSEFHIYKESLNDLDKMGMAVINTMFETTIFSILYTFQSMYILKEPSWVSNMIYGGLVYFISKVITDYVVKY